MSNDREYALPKTLMAEGVCRCVSSCNWTTIASVEPTDKQPNYWKGYACSVILVVVGANALANAVLFFTKSRAEVTERMGALILTASLAGFMFFSAYRIWKQRATDKLIYSLIGLAAVLMVLSGLSLASMFVFLIFTLLILEVRESLRPPH